MGAFVATVLLLSANAWTCGARRSNVDGFFPILFWLNLSLGAVVGAIAAYLRVARNRKIGFGVFCQPFFFVAILGTIIVTRMDSDNQPACYVISTIVTHVVFSLAVIYLSRPKS